MKTAFSGDLIQSPGKVQPLYDLQYQYGEHEGADLSVYSLNELIKLKPALVCPSHGTEMRDPEVGLRALAAKLGEWFLFWHPAGSRVAWDFEPVEITPHVLAHPQATCTFYAILSRSGKALLIDYGCASWSFFQSFLNATGVHDRIRFVEHGLDLLRTRYAVKSFDVAIASHIHDDHVNGFPHPARRYGTKVWCLENMVEIFENPHGRALGCILCEPLKIDRALKNNKTFRSEEYEFQIVHSPGHTEYEAALSQRLMESVWLSPAMHSFTTRCGRRRSDTISFFATMCEFSQRCASGRLPKIDSKRPGFQPGDSCPWAWRTLCRES